MFTVSVFKNKNDILDNPMPQMYSVDEIKPWFGKDYLFTEEDASMLKPSDISVMSGKISNFVPKDIVKVLYGVKLIDVQRDREILILLQNPTSVYVANEQNKTVNTFRHKVRYMLREEYEARLKEIEAQE